MDLEEVDPEQEQNQRERLEAVKADRDSDAVDDALAYAARGRAGVRKNVIPHIIDAVKSYGTVQEVSDEAPRGAWEYKPGR